MTNVWYQSRTYLRLREQKKYHMTKNKNLIVITSENPWLKSNKGLAKPINLGDSMSNIVLEQIQQVLGNLVWT